MKVSDQLREAAREFTPAEQSTLITIFNRLGGMGDAVDEAKSALAKYRSGERFAPQKDNLRAALHKLMTSAKATISFLDKLP